MKRKKKMPKDNADNILVRIKEAQDYKDWAEVSDILDEATKKDMDALKPIIPDLIEHHEWIVRASIVGLIGDFRLRQFLDLVKARLQDRNLVVRGYALVACYDILGAKALPIIEKNCSAKDVRQRLTALALNYIETGDTDAFKKLSRILTRKRCNLNHRSAILFILDYYCDVQPHSEIVELYEDILLDIPKSHGVAKDIRSMLNNWKKPK